MTTDRGPLRAPGPHDVHVPPVPKPRPPGAQVESATPQGVERHAQELVHEAGSVRKAKRAIDSAMQKETGSDFREDQLAVKWGFKSRKELLAASTPIYDQEGDSWWATALADGRWSVWNQNTIRPGMYSSLDEAMQGLSKPVADEKSSTKYPEGF